MARIKKRVNVSRKKIFRFPAIAMSERVKKATTGERYPKEKIGFTGDETDKKVKRNEEMESEFLMFELLEGVKTVDQLDYDQLVGLLLLLADNILKLKAREKELLKEGQSNSDNA